MAKLQLSVIASGISGKHSGGVFLKGNGGINIRRKVRPMQTASDYQANVKSHLTYVQSLWATLTSAQVKAWNLLAKTVKVSNVFGDKSALSGIALFQRLNNNLSSAGIVCILDAPALGSVGTVPGLGITVTHLGVISLSYGTIATPANFILIASCTPAIKVSRQVRDSDFRIVGDISAVAASPFDLSASYIAKFGSVLPVGTSVYCRIKILNKTTGQTGLSLQCSAIVS